MTAPEPERGLPGRLGLIALLWGIGLAGVLSSGDPAAAEALWLRAEALAGDDLAAPPYLDAARELARVRPWQTGFGTARARLDAIARARRAAADGE